MQLGSPSRVDHSASSADRAQGLELATWVVSIEAVLRSPLDARVRGMPATQQAVQRGEAASGGVGAFVREDEYEAYELRACEQPLALAPPSIPWQHDGLERLPLVHGLGGGPHCHRDGEGV